MVNDGGIEEGSGVSCGGFMGLDLDLVNQMERRKRMRTKMVPPETPSMIHKWRPKMEVCLES